MRLARSVLRRHAAAGDVHELVARRFVAKGFARVLDVGCGKGELARYLPDGAWVGLDNSQTMLDRGPAGASWARPPRFRSRTSPSTVSRSFTSSIIYPIPAVPSPRPTA
jgi:SAM-dependent methyltransferase